MSHSISFEINNGQEQFYAGTLVSGSVIFDLYEDVSSVEALVVLIEGKSKLHWSEHRNKQTHHYSNSEKYFKVENIVLQNIPNNTVSKGQHKFPFAFQLPADIPQTFHFKSYATASVKYSVKGRVKRSGLHFDIKGKHEIFVMGNTPISACPENPMAVAVGRGEKFICCWCCKQGPISAEITCDKTGFIPGEVMTINVNVENLSNTPLEVTKLNLNRSVRLKSRTKSRTFTDKPLSQAYEGCPARRSLNLTNKQLQVPIGTVPTGLPNCNIIVPEYFVEFEGVISGCHINFRVPCSVFMASVRFQVPQPAVGMAPPMPALPMAPAGADMPPSYTSAAVGEATTEPPPPSYNITSAAYPPPTGAAGATVFAPPATDASAPPAAGGYYDWNKSAFTYN